MTATVRPLLAAALLTAALAACDDPYAVEAQFEVAVDTFSVYSINDVPVGGPSAISLFGVLSNQPAVAATPALAFDLAVDVTVDGRARFITPRALVSLVPDSRTPPHPVGLQVVSTAYAALEVAPTGGYVYDSVLTVTPGQTVVVQSANPAACPVPYLGRMIYAKLVVDSVKRAPGRVFVRTTVDPNCDFKSLVPGIPKD